MVANCNGTGEALVEFLISSNLEILNQGNEPTFCSGHRLELIDIPLQSFGLLASIKGGRFVRNPPCQITDMFCLLYRSAYRYCWSGTLGAPFVRAWGTGWGGHLRWTWKMRQDCGLPIDWVQQALISACEDNGPLRPVKTGRFSVSLKWTLELEFLRRQVRWLLITAEQTRIGIVRNCTEGHWM